MDECLSVMQGIELHITEQSEFDFFDFRFTKKKETNAGAEVERGRSTRYIDLHPLPHSLNYNNYNYFFEKGDRVIDLETFELVLPKNNKLDRGDIVDDIGVVGISFVDD